MSREGESVSLVVLVAWMCAWKSWVRGRFLPRVSSRLCSRCGSGSVKALRGLMTGFAGWRDCWNQLDWGRIRFVGNDLVFVPVVSFTDRAPCMTEICPCGGKFVLLPKKFGKRRDVFRILMPTAPARIKPILPTQWQPTGVSFPTPVNSPIASRGVSNALTPRVLPLSF